MNFQQNHSHRYHQQLYQSMNRNNLYDKTYYQPSISYHDKLYKSTQPHFYHRNRIQKQHSYLNTKNIQNMITTQRQRQKCNKQSLQKIHKLNKQKLQVLKQMSNRNQTKKYNELDYCYNNYNSDKKRRVQFDHQIHSQKQNKLIKNQNNVLKPTTFSIQQPIHYYHNKQQPSHQQQFRSYHQLDHVNSFVSYSPQYKYNNKFIQQIKSKWEIQPSYNHHQKYNSMLNSYQNYLFQKKQQENYYQKHKYYPYHASENNFQNCAISSKQQYLHNYQLGLHQTPSNSHHPQLGYSSQQQKININNQLSNTKNQKPIIKNNIISNKLNQIQKANQVINLNDNNKDKQHQEYKENGKSNKSSSQKSGTSSRRRRKNNSTFREQHHSLQKRKKYNGKSRNTSRQLNDKIQTKNIQQYDKSRHRSLDIAKNNTRIDYKARKLLARRHRQNGKHYAKQYEYYLQKNTSNQKNKQYNYQRSKLIKSCDIYQKIKQRIKVSDLFYEDSQFNNIEHQKKHLENTFNKQNIQRKQLVNKICMQAKNQDKSKKRKRKNKF